MGKKETAESGLCAEMFFKHIAPNDGRPGAGPLSLFLPMVKPSIIFLLLSLAPRELWTKAATKTGLELGGSQKASDPLESELGRRLPAPDKADTPTLKKMGEK